MNIDVEYLDSSGNMSTRSYHISRLALTKHLAIAGQGYSPKPEKFLRTIGMFLHYSHYLQKNALNNNRFSEPPISLSDPTEKSQFSNIAGKAIADFLSKRIDSSLFTVNYEAAMRIKGMPVRGFRPDLIAYSPQAMFAIEAKGFTNGHGNMHAHKNQSKTGGIPVNYTIASISYDLYNQIKCKYHDPYNEDVNYDNKTLQNLTKVYYSGLAEFLDNKYFEKKTTQINGEKFYEIELSLRNFNAINYDSAFNFFWLDDIFHFFRPRLILPQNIKELAQNGITNNTEPFIFNSDSNNIYIDNDRVGLNVRRW
ncbi:MAG: hypothetical protein DCE86_00995 [Flavobacteriaceae bacterium]|nr:MAG: hypothetical protein DCE86_00995 [Flavobacteriaceae bacterium]